MTLDFSFIQKKLETSEILRMKYAKLEKQEKEQFGNVGRRITQKKIAKRVGCSDSMVSKWLSGERDLAIELLENMAQVLLEEEILLSMKCGDKPKI